MTKIKILHVIEGLNIGGAERVVANYVKYHDRDLFDPQVCALQEGGPVAKEIEAMGVKVTLLNKRVGLDWQLLTSLRRLIREERIRLLHLHNPPANNWGVPAAIANGGVTTIRTEHNIFYDGRVMKGYPLVNMLLGLFNHRIITVSEQVKASHWAKDWLWRGKYITVHNGIEGEVFGRPYDLEPLRREFGLTPGQPVVVKIASLTRQKNHHNFLEAVARLLQSHPQALFLVVGQGKRRSELEERARQLGLGDRLLFTGARSDIPALLQLATVFVLSSDWEGLPMTILEAMAAGRPCVVTDVGGNREAVCHGETGYLVEPGNPETLADHIARLLDEPELVRRFGEAGRKVFEERFAAEIMVRKTEAIYRQALGMPEV